MAKRTSSISMRLPVRWVNRSWTPQVGFSVGAEEGLTVDMRSDNGRRLGAGSGRGVKVGLGKRRKPRSQVSAEGLLGACSTVITTFCGGGFRLTRCQVTI